MAAVAHDDEGDLDDDDPDELARHNLLAQISMQKTQDLKLDFDAMVDDDDDD